MLNIGCHLSVSKGFLAMGKQAIAIGGNTFQFFTRNPRGGKAKDIDKADADGCKLVTLEVRSGNEAAMELYKKLGFREVGRRKGYYAKGGEDAVLMDLDLGKVEVEVAL